MHITRCLAPRPHNSGEAPCSFTMAPCVVVERFEGKQQCSRAPVGEHAEVQAQDAECGCHEQQEVNKNNQTIATAHHTIMTAWRPDNIRSSILVRGRSIRSMARSCRQPRRQLPRNDAHFRHFGGYLSTLQPHQKAPVSVATHRGHWQPCVKWVLTGQRE